MKRCKWLVVLVLSMFANYSNGQSFKDKFNASISRGDTLTQVRVLSEWQRAGGGDDAEFFIAKFNYYVNKSRSEIMIICAKPKSGGVFEIKNLDEPEGEPIAYMSIDANYNPALLGEAFRWINKGIKRYPDRLDMRFGKIYLYGMIGDFKNYKGDIIATIEHSAVNDNRWKWEDNEALSDAKSNMLSAIQDYQAQLFDTGDMTLVKYMRDIALVVNKYYPTHVESISNIAVTYLSEENYKKALEYLNEAEKLAPKDYIILNNTAFCYSELGDKDNAIKYYKLVMKYCPAEVKPEVKARIKALK